MSGTNPGTWPDQPEEKLFTAAEMKAARLETVERCMLAGLDCVDNPQNADLMYHGGLDGFIAIFEKLKEEIENE